jgi:CHAD domain-containing protein
LRLVWHDTATGALAAHGLAVIETRGRWRLEQRGGPGTPGHLLAEAPKPADLAGELPPDVALATLHPLAALHGTQRSFALNEGASLTLLSGDLRSVTASIPLCRLRLAGPPAALAVLSAVLAAALPLTVPWRWLAAEAMGLAGGEMTPPVRQPLPAGCGVVQGGVQLLGEASESLLFWVHALPTTPQEAVHQMRVSLRRLRALLALFAPALPGPETTALRAALRPLGACLGPVRDWDVFIGETCARVVATGDEATAASLAPVLRAAEHRQALHATALRTALAAPAFRQLAVALVCLLATVPGAAQPPPEDTTLADFAAAALARRLKRLLAHGPRIADLPGETLHAIRLQTKRLRYACDAFAPVLPARPTRRLLRRLSRLQECLGQFNDGATTRALLAELAAGGQDRAARAYARGLLVGFTTAEAGGARDSIAKAWKRLRAAAD